MNLAMPFYRGLTEKRKEKNIVIESEWD